MKVQLADLECSIEFAYETAMEPRAGGEERELTHCLIRDISAPRRSNDDAVILAQAEVVRYYKDPPNRELARKAALTKALAKLDEELPCKAIFLHARQQLAKARRKLFWTAYLNRKVDAAAMRSRVLSAPSNQPA